MKEILNVIHNTIYQFFDVCSDDEEVPMSDKDKLLLKVNKAICNNLKALEQQPCEDCISRQALIEKATSWDKHFADSERCVSLTDIQNAPPVTPQRLKGKWIEVFVETPNDPYSYGFKSHKCSKCEYRPLQILNYCPNCGADMREGEDKE